MISDRIRKGLKLCDEVFVSLPEAGGEILTVQQSTGDITGVYKEAEMRCMARFSDDIKPRSPAERSGDRDGKSDLKEILCHE